MGSKILAIAGSNRHNSNTEALLRRVLERLDNASVLNLLDHTIEQYTYDKISFSDDFPMIAKAMSDADVIIFASPVYWYSMSGPMKTFFDRLTNLTDIYKPLGKSLAGKSSFVVATGASPDMPDCFVQPFEKTAGYFKMHWGGALYGVDEGKDNGPSSDPAAVETFVQHIRRAARST